MKTVTISTMKPYDILIEEGILDSLPKIIEDKFPSPRKICIITDSKEGSKYSDKILKEIQRANFDAFKIVFPAGEHSKNLATYGNIMEAMADEGITRSDILLAIGGSDVQDIAGFAAGTYMRGIDYIAVPTTLMAIIDSSIGGKTGINLPDGKNLSGMFYPPSMVVADPLVLENLSEDQITDGMVEALKAAIISDSSLVNQILARNYEYIIDRCISIKKTLVEVDEKDIGLRQLLSFGHTIGYSIEKLTSYGMSHGRAVAKGLVAEARAAFAMGYCKTDISQELARILNEFGIDTSLNYDPDELYRHAMVDKKIRDGSISIVVPDVIGKCTVKRISLFELKQFIKAAVD